MVTPGARFHHEVMLTVDPDFRESGYAVRRTAGRFLEEVVELGLASGMTTGEILSRVADCLSKEAYKRKVFPSELDINVQPHSLREEIVDARILLDYTRFLASCAYGHNLFAEDVIKQGENQKLDVLATRAQHNALVSIDHCIYKRMQW